MDILTRTKPRLSRVALAVLVAAALATPASLALAQGAISDDQAKKIALQKVPGTVLDLERDDEDGVAVIEVEVRAQDGSIHEVTIDATSGAVLEVEEEDDGADEADEDDD